jgi:putative RecB family exonuclease
MDCGWHYKWSRIEKREPEFIPDSLVFGSAMHQTLADFHQERLIGHRMSLEELAGLFERTWRASVQRNERIRYRDGYDAEVCLNEGLSLLGVYHENAGEEAFNILAIEEPFHFELDGLDAPLVGVMDLVEQDDSGTVIITDFKTTGRAYSLDEVDQNFQLTVYHLAAKANGFGNREILLKFDCLVKTKKPRFERYYTTRSREAESAAIKKILAVRDGIRKQVFIPNYGTWKCKGCAYQKACREWLESSSPGGAE